MLSAIGMWQTMKSFLIRQERKRKRKKIYIYIKEIKQDSDRDGKILKGGSAFIFIYLFFISDGGKKNRCGRGRKTAHHQNGSSNIRNSHTVKIYRH